ncbi:hypothetical protein MTO96_051367 [Rhipicephalus appendiculatus]
MKVALVTVALVVIVIVITEVELAKPRNKPRLRVGKPGVRANRRRPGRLPHKPRPKKLGTGGGGKHAKPKVPASSTSAVTAGSGTESMPSQGMSGMGEYGRNGRHGNGRHGWIRNDGPIRNGIRRHGGGMGGMGGMGTMGKVMLGTTMASTMGSSLATTGTNIANTVLEHQRNSATNNVDSTDGSGGSVSKATNDEDGDGESGSNGDSKSTGSDSNATPETNKAAGKSMVGKKASSVTPPSASKLASRYR